MRTELIKSLIRAARNKDQGKVADLIINSGELSRAELNAAINSFLMTEVNIKENINTAKKLAAMDSEGGFVDQFRLFFLREMIKELEDSCCN